VPAHRRRGKIGRRAADPIAFKNALLFINPFLKRTGGYDAARSTAEISSAVGGNESSRFNFWRTECATRRL
jgi:hypothetical protein